MFPTETIGISAAGHKIVQFDLSGIYDLLYEQAIQNYWQQRHNISDNGWKETNWDAIGKAMKKLPPEAARWTSKNVYPPKDWTHPVFPLLIPTSLQNSQRTIGFDNLLRRRISKAWVDHQQQWLLAMATKWKPSATAWRRKLVKLLLESQWEFWWYRFDFVHNVEHPWNKQEVMNLIQKIKNQTEDPSRFL